MTAPPFTSRALHKSGALSEAIALYEGPAARGYTRALAALMVIYADNPQAGGASKAIPFGDACARQGDLICQTAMAQYYGEDREGLPRDDAKRLDYLRLAAEQGDGESQYWTGLAFERGRGVAPDPIAALTWYERAAGQGDIPAQYRLGKLFFEGELVPPDYAAALKWNRLVAERDATNAYAREALDLLAAQYFEGYGVEQNRATALYLYEKSAALGKTHAQSFAGWMYDEGIGAAEDDAKAVRYYLSAAEAGDFFAQNNLAVHYDEGKGVAEDEALALYWYEKAAAQGDAEDQFIVGERYRDGIGTAQDFYRAAEWFRRAAALGHAHAAAELEQMIADGLVVPGPAD